MRSSFATGAGVWFLACLIWKSETSNCSLKHARDDLAPTKSALFSRSRRWKERPGSHNLTHNVHFHKPRHRRRRLGNLHFLQTRAKREITSLFIHLCRLYINTKVLRAAVDVDSRHSSQHPHAYADVHSITTTHTHALLRHG